MKAHVDELRQPDTALADTRARSFLGVAPAGTVTELARRNVRMVGAISLGPDFTTDGTLITGDRTFMKFFSPHSLDERELPDIEIGVIKVRPGRSPARYSTRSSRHCRPVSWYAPRPSCSS